MTEREALLKAVETEPLSDTPRLALADRLDEEGGKVEHAFAEFIRLQCSAANLESSQKKIPVDTQRRIAKLFDENGKAFLELANISVSKNVHVYPTPLPHHPLPQSTLPQGTLTPAIGMHRGFPEKAVLACSPEEADDVQASLLYAEIRTMRLQIIHLIDFRLGSFLPLFNANKATLRELILECVVRSHDEYDDAREDWETLSMFGEYASPTLPSLEKIVLQKGFVDSPAEFTELISSRPTPFLQDFPRLQTLDLRECSLGTDDMINIIRSNVGAGIMVDLRENIVSNPELEWIREEAKAQKQKILLNHQRVNR